MMRRTRKRGAHRHDTETAFRFMLGTGRAESTTFFDPSQLLPCVCVSACFGNHRVMLRQVLGLLLAGGNSRHTTRCHAAPLGCGMQQWFALRSVYTYDDCCFGTWPCGGRTSEPTATQSTRAPAVTVNTPVLSHTVSPMSSGRSSSLSPSRGPGGGGFAEREPTGVARRSSE